MRNKKYLKVTVSAINMRFLLTPFFQGSNRAMKVFKHIQLSKKSKFKTQSNARRFLHSFRDLGCQIEHGSLDFLKNGVYVVLINVF